MEGNHQIDKALRLGWDLVCAIVNPKGRCAQEVRKNVLGEKRNELGEQSTQETPSS